MRLGLADVKKRVLRRQGEAYLAPHLLRAGELRAELGALIGLFEGWLGRDRGAFPVDRPAELTGDYRLARGLVVVLSEWYAWEPPAWPGPASDAEAAALAVRGIASPSQLRLALYDAVSAAHGGYLAACEREAALDAIAAGFDVSRATLDTLLALDGEDQARLVRTAPAAPTPGALAARYNRRAVEALLANAAAVDWLVPPEVAAAQGTSLGTLLKRICFLARRLGVYYDVAFADAPADEPGEREALARVAELPALYTAAAADADAQPLDAMRRALAITLYGPQEAFGGPTLYGDRLARLCRILLGYHRRDQAPASDADSVAPEWAPVALRGAGLRGEARVMLHGQPFRFALDERLLALLEDTGDAAGEDQAADPTERAAPDSARVAFDSSVERRLHDEFASLARADGAHGWRMEREPEPVLCGETILIPDFALTRGARRVYLEVAGFWSPAYRERKRRKLAALAGRVALVVAAPDAARAELAGVETSFPVLWYRDQVSAQALVTLLEAHYDDFAARRAAVKAAAVLAEVARRGLLPWAECAAALHAYSRTELRLVADDLAQAARARDIAPPELVEGVGLASDAWLARAGDLLGRWVDASGADGLALGEVTRRAGELDASLAPAALGAAAAESLARAIGFAIARASLFEPRVVRPAASDAPAAALAASVPTPTQPRPPHRRTHQQRPSRTPPAPPSLWEDGDSPAGTG